MSAKKNEKELTFQTTQNAEETVVFAPVNYIFVGPFVHCLGGPLWYFVILFMFISVFLDRKILFHVCTKGYIYGIKIPSVISDTTVWAKFSYGFRSCLSIASSHCYHQNMIQLLSPNAGQVKSACS